MSNFTRSITIDIVLNLISIVLDILGLLVCFVLISSIIYRLIKLKNNRRQIINDVPLILCINIIFVIFIKSTLQIIHVSFPTLIRDFYPNIEFRETSLFRYRAYMLWSMTGVLFWSYVILTFFSFVRVIYPMKLWFHQSFLYLYILIPCQFIFTFIVVLPLLFGFNSLHQIPDEAYCSVALLPVYSLIYINTVNFALPLNVICIFYICIARKMRQVSMRIQNLEHMHRRDFIVIKRMIFNIIILSTLAIPYIILFLIDVIQNNFGSTIYRVQWLSSSTGSFLFSFVLPFVSKRLQDFLRPNRLEPIHVHNNI